MNYFHIYQQNPRLLRPQGGRHDERRLSGSLYHQASGTSVGENVRPTATTDANAVRTSHSHLVFNSPKTNKIAPEDIQLKREDEATKKGSDAAARSVSSSSLRPYSMSISNLLSNDSVMSKQPQLRNGSDHRYTSVSSNSSVTNGSTGGSVGSIKRKKVSKIDQDVDGEPPKRRRMSKKRAAELGLLDADGNILKKRKRTKKMHDSDHVSPSGFRHGGERVVQEPDELVVLAPDVGPVAMLDTDSLPPVVWKGHPLSVVGKPGYEQLHPYEEHIASTLRLSPAQYLNCKRTLILASREYHATPDGKQFRKSDAQKLCRIDVNKTSRLWEVFAKIGWLEGISEKDI
ncbi:hypothetical protein BGZ98_000344 [Dissophora globulifera]|nr:hypothetical protein BGZ98_000344 [Dissophora globulifera]